MATVKYERELCVLGYHVYKRISDASVGETLVCSRESGNLHDRYAVSVEKNGRVIGHLPRTVSRACALFLKNESICCKVTGRQKYSSDLRQGGLEIPCMVTFIGKSREIQKLK